MMTIKKFPFGNRFFKEIRDENLLYADKTEYIYHLVRKPRGNYFLSRPRCFGKTLLLYTFKELFSGNRDRFKGLWIDQSDYTFPQHPVILLSLSMDARSPEIVKESLYAKLMDIAFRENLNIEKAPLPEYFRRLIEALYHKNNNTKVVILIDEYDYPVSRAINDVKLAQANADIVGAFFAVLKDPLATNFIRFTFITGIARYPLTFMGPNLNHLLEISLDPKYAGICGFTIEEFDSLFADRMESTLAKLKNDERLPLSATVEDLKAKIHYWYDGYSWGGQTRVLNPYTILRFFYYGSFNNYWFQSGRPTNLTTMIQSKPIDFIIPRFDSYSFNDLEWSELNNLQVVPFLFHSGYLTIDKISNTSSANFSTSYSFRLPNNEVSSSYYRDCFKVIFGSKSDLDISTKAKELKEAFLTKNAPAVSDIFSAFFSAITSLHRLDKEQSFHSVIQSILLALNFKVLSELSGTIGRLNLCLELPDQVYLNIQLKYCPMTETLTKKEINMVLATYAISTFPDDITNQALSMAVQRKLKFKGTDQLLTELSAKNLEKADKDRLMAQAGKEKILTEDEVALVLANFYRSQISNNEIDKILSQEITDYNNQEGQIDELLSKATHRALKDIAEKDYHGVVKLRAKKIIDLGLAVYGRGTQVKAAFGPRETVTHGIGTKKNNII
jgi:hypothetical protein